MKALLFYTSAGHGHRKAAEAIAKALLEHGSGKQDIILKDALELAPAFVRNGYLSYYFYSVKHVPKFWGWNYEQTDRGLAYHLTFPVRSMFNRLIGGRVLAEIDRQKPDVVVNTHFFAAELLARAKREGRISAHLMTVITDMFPHRFWINRGTDS